MTRTVGRLLGGVVAAYLIGVAPAWAGSLTVNAGAGSKLVLTDSPFQVGLYDSSGRREMGTVAGLAGAPVRVPGVDGPQPVEPLGSAGGYPAVGWVVGSAVGVANPAPPFTGNRVFGAEAGAIVSVTGFAGDPVRTAGGWHVDLATDAAGLGSASLNVSVLPGGGVSLDLRPPPGLPGIVSTMTTLESTSDEGLYGLGARRDAFNQRGLLRNVWVEEQYLGWDMTEPVTSADASGTTGPAYSFPNGAQEAFFVQAELSGSNGWTAWVPQSQLQRLDLANSSPDRVRWGVAADHLVLRLAGGGVGRSVAAYSADTGRAPAPPPYVYAPWLDRINETGEGEAAPNGGGFNGGDAVKTDVTDFVKRIAADALPIRTFGIEGWQAVPGGDTFFPWLKSKGYRLVAYWNPFLSPGKAVTDEAIAKGVVVKDANHDPYPIVTNRQNTSYVVDFSAPGAQAFWDEQLARSCDLGFEGTHADFGEFVIDGMVFADGTPPAVMHNRYPVLYARATRHALEVCASRRPGIEPFFYVRAGYGPTGFGGAPGATRDTPEGGTLGYTPADIIGDETTDWAKASGIASVPPAMLNFAMGGGSTFISDVGGYLDLYAPRTSPELFARWSELSALTTVMRIHDSTYNGSVYPWTFGPAIEDIYRRYARLKARLAGLVAHYTALASSAGAIGPVRPLLLDDSSPEGRSVSDEWLLGRDLLVAPVVVKGAVSRSVYLPAGASWQRVVVAANGYLVNAGAPVAGGQRLTAPAPLEDIALYERVGGTELASYLGAGGVASHRRTVRHRHRRKHCRGGRRCRVTRHARRPLHRS